jgi:hypothetical protein
MGIEEEVNATAEDILKQNSTGLTKEALVRQIEPRLPNRLLPAQIIGMLRKQPQRFVEGGDGRWRLREQIGLSDLDDPREATYETATPQLPLRQGCYVVFDLQRCAKRMSLFITACFLQLEHSHSG